MTVFSYGSSTRTGKEDFPSQWQCLFGHWFISLAVRLYQHCHYLSSLNRKWPLQCNEESVCSSRRIHTVTCQLESKTSHLFMVWQRCVTFILAAYLKAVKVWKMIVNDSFETIWAVLRGAGPEVFEFCLKKNRAIGYFKKRWKCLVFGNCTTTKWLNIYLAWRKTTKWFKNPSTEIWYLELETVLTLTDI